MAGGGPLAVKFRAKRDLPSLPGEQQLTYDPMLMPEPPDKTDALLDGQYKLGGALCQTGLGVLYRAERLATGEPCSVSLLPWTQQLDLQTRARLRRDSLATQELGSPHLVQVRELGDTTDQMVYVVLPPLEGQTLEARLEVLGQLELCAAVATLAQLAQALDAAHQRGMIHGCLSPASLLLCPGPGGDEQVKVLDFGAGRVLRELPRAPQLENLHPYRPPAISDCGAAASDPCLDLHAAGVMLHQLLTGRLPSQGPVSAGGVSPELDRHVAAVVSRALAADPTVRFRSMAALMEALEDLTGRVDAGGGAQVRPDPMRVTAVVPSGDVPDRKTAVMPAGAAPLKVNPTDDTVVEPADAGRTAVRVEPRRGADRGGEDTTRNLRRDPDAAPEADRDDGTERYQRQDQDPTEVVVDPGAQTAVLQHDRAPTEILAVRAPAADDAALGAAPAAPNRSRSKRGAVLLALAAALLVAASAILAVVVANTGLPAEDVSAATETSPPTPALASAAPRKPAKVRVEALPPRDLSAPPRDAAGPPPDASRPEPPPVVVQRRRSRSPRRKRPARRRRPRSTRAAPAKPVAGQAWLTVVTRSGAAEVWADIFLDGKTIGRSMLYRRKVSAGVHLVTAKKAHHQTAQRKIMLRRGQEMRLILQLKRHK